MKDAIRIDLNDYVKSGEGANGASYDCISDPDVMVKLYCKEYPTDTIYTELEIARKVYEAGVSSPEPGELVTDGERLGIRFRRIIGKRSFARAISQEPERCEEFSREYARMCKKLHSTHCPSGMFPDAKPQFLHLLEADHTFTEDKKAIIAEYIRNVPDTDTALHGDMHIGNALTTLPSGAPFTDKHELYFIDLGYFAQGYPLFDVAMLQNICLFADDDFRVENFHIGHDITEKVWDYFVDEYFFGPEKLAEKYFGKGAGIAEVNKGMMKFTAIKLFLVSFNLGFMPPNYIPVIEKAFFE